MRIFNDPLGTHEAGCTLVDTAAGHPVAVIPGFHYFAGSEDHQNRRSLSDAWSPASKSGLAIYEGRYAYESIVWIDPEARRFTSIGALLEKALRRTIDKNHPKRIAGLASSLAFTSPVLIGPDTFVSHPLTTVSPRPRKPAQSGRAPRLCQ